MAGDIRPGRGGRAWLANRFWLVLPPLLLNVPLTPALPAAYRPDVFSAGLPVGLEAAETVLRLLVSTAPLLMPLRPPDLRPGGWGKQGFALYTSGLLAYAAAWAAVIAAPDSAWSQSPVGFTAPAWTSLIWLAGIGWHSRLPWKRYHPWMYLAAVVLFTTVHTAHAALVWCRTAGVGMTGV